MGSDEQIGPAQSRWKTLLDMFWATAWRLKNPPPLEAVWPRSISLKIETLERAREVLKEEHDAELDRIRVVETKLLGITSLAPVAMAVVVAGFTVLANGNVQSFTRGSVVLIGVAEGYVCVQFLRAVLGAISGLRRRFFSVMTLEDLYPKPNETREQYLRRNCEEMASNIRQNRAEIDAKVTWLDVAHTSIRNAVAGLLVLVLLLILLAAFQA